MYPKVSECSCKCKHFHLVTGYLQKTQFYYLPRGLSVVSFVLISREILRTALVWGIKLKKVDLSWPTVFSKSYNPSWIELNFLSSPWIELTQSLHIWSRLDLTQVEYTNSSQLRVDSKLKKINFFQVNSRKSWKKLNLIEWPFYAAFMK